MLLDAQDQPVQAGRPMATYRIAVGRRQQVQPGMIVGALANEGGLRRQDFGRIDIRSDHSLVDLPADLPDEVLRRLARTRISGQRIDLAPDTGRKPRGKGDHKHYDKKGSKPRHKKAHG
jgi:ATP-dependent RNA helicase DeaD